MRNRLLVPCLLMLSACADLPGTWPWDHDMGDWRAAHPANTDADGDGYASDVDCDDGDAAVHPAATELCNEMDDDCDGATDEADATDAATWYADSDGDGYGDPAVSDLACSQPSGHVADDTDCDDGDAAVHPGASEVWYDGVDQDCDGWSDYDQDGDGCDSDEYGGDDCDDTDAFVYPGAVSDHEGLAMAYICPGTFTMGSPPSEVGRGSYETQHEVTLTGGFYLAAGDKTRIYCASRSATICPPCLRRRPRRMKIRLRPAPLRRTCIWMRLPPLVTIRPAASRRPVLSPAVGVYELTQLEFEDFMGYQPSSFSGCDDCPAENMNWFEAAAFANAVSTAAGLAECYTCSGTGASLTCDLDSTYAIPYHCLGYRLPTEAEWEYAARAGTSSAFSNGGNLYAGDTLDCGGSLLLDNSTYLDDIAVYCGIDPGQTEEVGTKEPNPWGLYDMHGNVYEWCHDWWNGSDYSGDTTDPWGNASGSIRVKRGGSWNYYPRYLRSANRNGYAPSYDYDSLGLRLARSE